MNSLNGLDFAIIFAFLAIIGLGFFGGVTRVVAAIVSIYLGSIIAAAFYSGLTESIRERIFSMSLATGQLVVFCSLFVISSTILWFVLAKGLQGVRFPRRLEIADNLGGAALGLIVSGLAVTLAAMLMSILLQVLNQTVGAGSSDSIVGSVQAQIRNSELVPLFLDLTPYLNRLIEPWFPGGVPSILS
jgi:uncharacterized membrane protein required for colicin V production